MGLYFEENSYYVQNGVKWGCFSTQYQRFWAFFLHVLNFSEIVTDDKY